MVLFLVLLLLAIVALFVIGGFVVGVALKLLWWAIIGVVIGAVARLILPGEQAIGILGTILSGLAGALIGGVIANAVGVPSVLQFVIAVLVAAVLIAIFAGRERAQAR